MTTRPVGAELFLCGWTEGRMDGHDDANICFLTHHRNPVVCGANTGTVKIRKNLNKRTKCGNNLTS